MPMTPRQLNRATLARQLLLGRERLSVVDGVRRVVALQAQEPASPYVALWNRLFDFDPAELDAAFAARAVAKASLMRITLHAVAADDYTTCHQAMLGTLRASRLHDRRFQETGLSIEDADALVPHVVALCREPRSKDEIEAMLADRLGSAPDRHVWWALRTYAPLIHAPTGGPWSFGQRPSFQAAPTETDRDTRETATRHLLERYLEAFGPATAQDFAQFALLRQPSVRPALEALGDALITHEGPDGGPLFDVPGAPLPDEDTPAPPRLLAMWESILLAYADRSRVIPDPYRAQVIRRNGNVLPTLLVDGYVSGVWRHVDGQIEALAFHRLPESAWEGLAAEARALLDLVAERDPAVYGRYSNWWSSLDGAETRFLAG
jgi:hypothetical protein